MEQVIRRIGRLLSRSAIVITITTTSLSAWSQQTAVAPPVSRWVATWSAAPMAPGSGLEAPQTFENQTVRHVVHISAGGQRIRVRLSNAYGSAPLLVGTAHVAVHADGASILAGSDRTLTFSGQTSISIPTGAVALSDPVALNVPSLADLSVSIYVPNNTGPATYHESSDQTSYISGPGDFTSAVVFPTAQTSLSRFWLVDVEAEPLFKIGAVVAVGDSITTSFRSTVDGNRRWTDDLAARLDSPGRPAQLAVLNEGIGCSRLLWDFCGPSGSSRFDRDVLALTGVTHVVLDLGLVDIVFPTVAGVPDQAVTANQIIIGLRQMIERAHVGGVKIIGATLTPNKGSTFPGFFTPENEVKRQAVNQWIRTSGAYDGVIDFDKAVRDPSDPTRLLPAYASDDNTHLSDAGYQAMANAIDLSLFR
jgi:lysophospholipase L1-like esterase